MIHDSYNGLKVHLLNNLKYVLVDQLLVWIFNFNWSTPHMLTQNSIAFLSKWIKKIYRKTIQFMIPRYLNKSIKPIENYKKPFFLTISVSNTYNVRQISWSTSCNTRAGRHEHIHIGNSLVIFHIGNKAKNQICCISTYTAAGSSCMSWSFAQSSPNHRYCTNHGRRARPRHRGSRVTSFKFLDQFLGIKTVET